jgi:DNA-binding transcriptional LysR family regulator
MFDPWQLRTLRELDRRGTMAAVADAFSLTPSAVSQQVASLEREAGVRLIEPRGRRVRLTAAGLVLAERADAILVALQEAAEAVTDLAGDAAGILRLASFPTAAAALCPAVIAGLAELHPRHQVTLIETEPAIAIDAVLAGEVDLAIVDEPALPVQGRSAAISHEEIYADPLFVVMRADHPLAGRPKIDLRAMASETWVMDHPTCSFFRVTVDLCQAAGFEPNIVANTESVSVSAALVRAGAGTAILPGLALIGASDLVFRPIAPKVVRRLYAVYRKGSNSRPSIATALRLLRETAHAVGESIAPAVQATRSSPNQGRSRR